MTKEEVLQLVEDARTQQRGLWPHDTGDPHEQQYIFWGPHFLVLEEKVTRIRALWYESVGEEVLRKEFAKIAAIALRAMEEVPVRGGDQCN